MNILVIGAHPDDVELSVGGTLLRYKKDGHKIFIALTTSGNIGSATHSSKEEIADVREAEMLEGAKFFDAQVRFLRNDDELLHNDPETRLQVLNAIRWADPDVIFTHHPSDRSPDHHTTAEIVSDVMLSLGAPLLPTEFKPCTKKPSVFFWEPTAGIGFRPEVYVDISDVIEEKKAALSCHVSQNEWMATYMDRTLIDYVEIIGAFRGFQQGYMYAEAFSTFRIHGFMPDYKLLP